MTSQQHREKLDTTDDTEKWLCGSVWMVWFLAVAWCYLVRLSLPAEPYFDEVYHVKAAQAFLGLHTPEAFWTAHPRLGHLLVAFGIHLFGNHPWAWRIVPALAGVGMLAALYVLARCLTRNAWIARWSVALFVLAGVPITTARLALLNSVMLLFMLLTCWLFCRRSWMLAGVFLGLALSTKWTALMTWLFLLVGVIIEARRSPHRLALIGESLVAFVLIPLGVYVLVAMMPLPGHYPISWEQFLQEQARIFSYHSSLTATHHYGSPWWGWPLLLRPIWYFFEREGGRVTGILCIGNPAIFWMIPLAIGYTLWQLIRKPNVASGLILAGFLIHWVLYGVVQRVQFFHYVETALPFAMMALAAALHRLWHTGRSGRRVVRGYLVVVVGLFLYWLPLWIGWPISEAFYRHHVWFPSWI